MEKPSNRLKATCFRQFNYTDANLAFSQKFSENTTKKQLYQVKTEKVELSLEKTKTRLLVDLDLLTILSLTH